MESVWPYRQLPSCRRASTRTHFYGSNRAWSFSEVDGSFYMGCRTFLHAG
jgi:hypothetical protein